MFSYHIYFVVVAKVSQNTTSIQITLQDSDDTIFFYTYSLTNITVKHFETVDC